MLPLPGRCPRSLTNLVPLAGYFSESLPTCTASLAGPTDAHHSGSVEQSTDYSTTWADSAPRVALIQLHRVHALHVVEFPCSSVPACHAAEGQGHTHCKESRSMRSSLQRRTSRTRQLR